MDLLISAASSYFFNLLKAISDPVFVAAADYAGAHGAKAIKDALMPKLDNMDRHIKDLSLSKYRASLYHMLVAKALIEDLKEELNEELYEDGQATLIDMRQHTESEKELPPDILRHIENAYNNAILAYNSQENLNLEYRIHAVQVAMLCIWLQNTWSPKKVIIEWRVQFKELMQDQFILRCMKYTLVKSKIPKMIHKQKKSDLELLAILAHDVISCITSTAQKQNLKRSDTLEFLDDIILPENLDPDLRTKWAQYIRWKDYINGYQLCQEIPFQNDQGIETIAGCCLPDGKLVVVENNGKVTLFNKDLKEQVSKEGNYGGIAYDSSNNQLLAWDRVNNAFESLNPSDLSMNGFSISCPNFGAIENIVDLLVSVTSMGTIVTLPKLKAGIQMENDTSVLQFRRPESINWTPVTGHWILDGKTLFTGLAAIEDAHYGLKIAISDNLTCFLLNVSSSDMRSFDFVNPEAQRVKNGYHHRPAAVSHLCQLANSISSSEELIQESNNKTCVIFYSNSQLIAVFERHKAYLFKENEQEKKVELLNHQVEEYLSGTWIASANIYVYVTKVCGSVEQRPRFAMQIICKH